MSYSKTHKTVFPGLGGWTYQGDVALGDPPAGGFYVDQTSMSSGAPTIELNVTDDNGIDHSDWLQDLVNTNHLILRDRACPEDSLLLEISSNGSGAGFRTLVGDIRSGSGTFRVGATYDLWSITTSEDFVTGPASSTLNAVPTFSDTTGKVVQNNPTLKYDTGELQLEAATAALEIQERNLAPTFAVAKGHIWVRDDAPNTLVFTDDTGADHPIFDFIVGPASSTLNAVPTFSGGTGKVLQDTDLLYASGELQLTSATSALEIQDRAAAPAFAAGKGHVWAKNNDPNTFVFTDDTGADHPIALPNSVLLGEWKFGGALGITPVGEFETSPTSPLTSITAIRFNGYPVTGTGQLMSWSSLLPQEGILYLQDVTDPGGTSVTFHYTSLTFPLGGLWPQFNGAVLSTNGTVHGTNWSANNYSLQLVAVDPSLSTVILGSATDNDVTVLSTEPIIFRDNAVNFTPFEIVSTNATTTTPSIKVTKLAFPWVAFQAETTGGASGISITPSAIEPYANTASNVNYYVDPVDTTSGTYHGVDVTYTGGAHTGTQRGGNLTLGGGISGSGTDGSVNIGVNGTTEEITLSTGFTLAEGADHPVTPAPGKAQLWLSTEFDETSQPSVQINDDHILKMTQYPDHDIELSWLGANYKGMIGGQLAFGRLEEVGITGGTTKTALDADVSFFYDHLSNMWYQSFIDASLQDAKVSHSTDGGYTWATFKTVDTSIANNDLAPPATDGTKLGIAADGNFYLSTDLTSTNLPGTATGSPTNITGSTGLVWHIGSQLWVMCGDNGTTGYVYTSPAAGTTWTLRYTFPVGILPKSMDIAHPGYGGYTGTERILIAVGSTSFNTFWSDNGTTWNQDTTGNPTLGLNQVVWCPSIGSTSSLNKGASPGAWLGLDTSKNVWCSISWSTGDWHDSGANADFLWKTDEWCGYGTNSTTASNNYQFTHIADTVGATGGFIRGRICGTIYYSCLPMHRSSSTVNKARFTWGNGVIMFDREDGELVIGRYGPIT